MSAAVIKVTAEQRNEKVRAVLRNSLRPMSPTDIARAISEDWCCYGGQPCGAHSAAISPVLKRIGALGVKGKWSLPGDGAPGMLKKISLDKVVAHLRKVADEIESGEAILSNMSTWGDSLASSLTVEMAHRRVAKTGRAA